MSSVYSKYTGGRAAPVVSGGNYSRYPSASSGPTVPFLLNTVGIAAALAYSTRKLSSTYMGPSLRVRRDSDNAEQDIGFTAGANLDTTALTNFVGGANGLVVVWYDQSGNGNNAVNGTALTQPFIVVSGTVTIVNGLPSIYFNGMGSNTSFLGVPAANSLFPLSDNLTVASRQNTSAFGPSIWQGFFMGAGGTNAQGLGWLGSAPTELALNANFGAFAIDNINVDTVPVVGPSPAQSDTALHQLACWDDPIRSSDTWRNPTAGFGIGTGDPSFNNLVGFIAELVIYSTALGSSGRATGSANQKAYWGTP